MDKLMKVKPGLPKFWLHLLSGLMWSAVGLYLISLTRDWIFPEPGGIIALIIIGGGLLGAVIYTFGFSKLADMNIHRVNSIPSNKPCLFAFQSWTSYPLVAFMISLGIFLRVYSPIPKSLLAVMYIGIGLSLFMASLRYYRHLRSISPR